ncbi:hypothetical protein AcV7_002001 [Taiwanofungus camphoratus]|nr:hypothetical protein AcV7_002001 [Antrodia cinnamomea]
MDALEHRVARDLFEVARVIARQFREAEQRGSGSTVDTAEGDNEEGMFEFNASFLELLGKRAVDLLQPTDGFPLDSRGNPVRTEVAIQENKVIISLLVVSLSCPQAGEVRPRVIDSVFHSSKELETLITTALSHRRTSATARNAASSRSHAILTIRVKNKLLPYADEGQLILVDLAGSERYEDSKEHDKQRMLESRENKSLMNLKECVRPKAKMANEEGSVHIPWRMNKFPMLLKPIFDVESRQASKTLIIAHASPHIQDSMHSVNTLSYASPFKTSPPAPYDPADPRTWDHDHTMQWLTAEYTKRARRRQAAAYKVKEKEAERRGEKLRPLDPNAPVQLAVHVDGLCPGDMTAGYFGRMHTAEFVQRCLEVANLGEEVTTDVVRNVSVEVVGALYYLMLSAKTKTQNEIMKSRKKLEVAVNGEMPERTISSTDPDVSDVVIPGYSDLGIYSDKEILNTVKRLGQSWFQTIDIAASEANTEAAEDESLTRVDKAKVDAIKKMMEAFSIEEAQTTAQSVHFCLVIRDYCIISGFTGFCKRLERELQRTPSLILRDESRK